MARLGKECVVVTDHWWPFPQLLSPTNTKVANAALKQVIDSLANLRLHITLLIPDVEYTVLWQIFPSHDHTSETGKTGVVVGTEGEVRETGLGRRKTKENTWRRKTEENTWANYQNEGEEQEARWEAAQQKGKPQQKRSVIPFEKLRHPEMLLKG